MESSNSENQNVAESINELPTDATTAVSCEIDKSSTNETVTVSVESDEKAESDILPTDDSSERMLPIPDAPENNDLGDEEGAIAVKVRDDGDGGLEDEMEAMFGDSNSPDVVKKDERSEELAEPNLASVEADNSSKPDDDENVASKDQSDEPEAKLDQTLDESNLETMMEALHADKLDELEPNVPKQSDTPGMELHDVLQALTGDMDDNAQKSPDGKSKKGKKDAVLTYTSKLRSTSDHHGSDVEGESNKTRGAGSTKKLTRKTRRQSSEFEDEHSDESESETSKSALKPKTRSEEDEEEDDQAQSAKSNRGRGRTRGRPRKSSVDSGVHGKKGQSASDLVSRSNKVCILPHCRQRCFPQLGISLHRFPFVNNPMRNIWLKLVEQKPPGPVTAYICSKHFKNDDYYDDTTSPLAANRDPNETVFRKLKPKAFPTVNLPVSYRVIEDIKKKFQTAEHILEARRRKAAEREAKKLKGTKEEESDSEDDEGTPRSLRSGGTPSASDKMAKADPDATPSSSQSASKAASAKKRLDSETKYRGPGTNCSVPCCGNNLFKTRAEGLNISYYRFPFNDDLAQKWIKKIGDPDLNSRTARICSDHFADKDFEGSSGGKKNLKSKAVPSLYLSEKKPVRSDSYGEDSDDDDLRGRKKLKRKERKVSKKLDTSAIVMPLPMIPDAEIKSEPPSDDEGVGQEYVAEDTVADEDLNNEIEEVKAKSTRATVKQDLLKTTETPKRPRGRPKKVLGSPPLDEEDSSRIKTVTLSSLDGPSVALEKLSHRVIKAADSGSLRVRIKESAPQKLPPRQKPCPKSRKKRLIESEESSDDEADSQNVSASEAERLKRISKPGPLSKKRKMLEKLEAKDAKDAKTVDDSEEDADDPAPLSPGYDDTSGSPGKSSNIVKVKPAELPKFLHDKKTALKGSLKRKCSDNDGLNEDVNSILASDGTEQQKIAKLVEHRISEHTKIIDQRPIGLQQLADHNKILQGSALVLKKLAEKTGKTLPASQIIPLNVLDNTTVTPGRTIVLKKVTDPAKLGLKPPIKTGLSKPSPLAASSKSSPTRNRSELSSQSDEVPGPVKPCSPLEKIRDYDNLMRKYLNAVADKSLISRKFMEAKESQRILETKLEEKEKELELVKRKVSVSQIRLNKIVASLEHFLTPNQIKLALQETKKVAWTPEEMLMAFTIKHLSKACYLFLRHKLNYPLPGLSSLQRWMGMLSKDKGEDDDVHLADDDASDKEETGVNVQANDESGVMNEITGTLEEINASSVQSTKEDDPTYVPRMTMLEDIMSPAQSSPFQIVYENDCSGQGTRKVIILKKVPNVGVENKTKNKLQISASENDVNVNNIAGTGNKNEIFKMLPRAKTISMSGTAEDVPSSQSKRVRYIVSKNVKEKEKLSFNRLPKVRQEMLQPKPPRIQIVKSEPIATDDIQQDQTMQHMTFGQQHSVSMVNDISDMNAIVKPEHVITQVSDAGHSSIEEGHKQIFTLSDLAATQGETIVESVDVEGNIDQEMITTEQLIHPGDLETITIMKEDGQFEQHQIRRTDAMQQSLGAASGLEQLVHMATSEEQQQITFASHHIPVVSEAEGVTPGEHYAQIAFAATQGSVPGEITLHEDMNNMTAVVINDIDEEQLNTLLMSNAVEQRDVTVDEAATSYQHKEIVYQTITDDKNVIVLQPESQAFVEEDEGTSRRTYSGSQRVFVVDEEGCLVPAPKNEPIPNYSTQDAPAQDDNLLTDFSLHFNDPSNPYSIHHLIENYAIRSPAVSPKRQ